MYFKNDIILRDGKVTKKYVESLDTNPLVMILNHSEYPLALQLWTQEFNSNNWELLSKESLVKFGKPNIEFRNYESSPGVWIFDDTKTGIIWVIWTDLHHKHPWKGTSYEAIVPEYIDDRTLTDAIERMIPILMDI